MVLPWRPGQAQALQRVVSKREGRVPRHAPVDASPILLVQQGHSVGMAQAKCFW